MRLRTQREVALLRARGYDGLFWRHGSETCGCHVNDLRPCGQPKGSGCRPARRGEDGLMYPTLRRREEKA